VLLAGESVDTLILLPTACAALSNWEGSSTTHSPLLLSLSSTPPLPLLTKRHYKPNSSRGRELPGKVTTTLLFSLPDYPDRTVYDYVHTHTDWSNSLVPPLSFEEHSTAERHTPTATVKTVSS